MSQRITGKKEGGEKCKGRSGVWKGRNEVTMKFPAFLNILMQVFKKFPWHVPCYELLVAVIDAPRLLLQICIFLRGEKEEK